MQRGSLQSRPIPTDIGLSSLDVWRIYDGHIVLFLCHKRSHDSNTSTMSSQREQCVICFHTLREQQEVNYKR